MAAILPPATPPSAAETAMTKGHHPAEPVALEVHNIEPTAEHEAVKVAVATEAEEASAKPSRRAQVKGSVSKIRQRVAQLIAIPIKITRPLREVVLAVGVIGVLSLGALFGIPWRKRRIERPKSSPPLTDQ